MQTKIMFLEDKIEYGIALPRSVECNQSRRSYWLTFKICKEGSTSTSYTWISCAMKILWCVILLVDIMDVLRGNKPP